MKTTTDSKNTPWTVRLIACGETQTQMPFAKLVEAVPELHYEGERLHGVPHGNGRVTVDGDVVQWEGVFRNGILASGRMYQDGVVSYDGPLFQLLPKGQGHWRQEDCSEYAGEVHTVLVRDTPPATSATETLGSCSVRIAVQANGKGMRKETTGNILHGTFCNGWLTQGSINACGKTWAGQFRQSKQHGQGSIWQHAPHGRIHYTGEFKNGLKCGKGVMVIPGPNGWTYDGEWHNNMPHGDGCLKMADGREYTGAFVQGTLNGARILGKKSEWRTLLG